METVADIMKMDREKQSRPINTAEVFAERSLRYTVAGHLLLAQSSYTVAGHLLLVQSTLYCRRAPAPSRRAPAPSAV